MLFRSNDRSDDDNIETVNIDDVNLDLISEETFSEQELELYKSSLSDPYVTHVRKVFDGYLDGSNFGMDAAEIVIESKTDGDIIYGLSSFEKTYYKSKFTVWQIDQFLGGGKEITLIPQDKPEKIFHAWVYKLDGEEKYDLRAFWEDTKSSKGIKILLKAYGKYILDKEYGI